ncbi:MAG TPA: homoserine kinase [Opitutaceae bacterium]|jgi:homoserine kinase
MSAGGPKRASVSIRVPGSTSNCGAGFDTLGLAVQLYNTVTLGPADSFAAPRDERDARASQMVSSAARAFFSCVGLPLAPFGYHIEGGVPAARGLGSSVTVIAGILAGLNELHGTALERSELVRLASAEEGHPDNASAGILGGFCVSRCDPQTGRYLDTLRFEVPPSVALVVVSPEVELLTKESRGVLPRTLGYFDAVRSINSAAYVVAAFASHHYDRLKHAAGDFMHEPYRLPKIRGAAEAIAAGVGAGAYTGWLSGSGSSVLCVADSARAPVISAAMAGAFAAAGVPATGRVLAADNHGLRVQ